MAKKKKKKKSKKRSSGVLEGFDEYGEFGKLNSVYGKLKNYTITVI